MNAPSPRPILHGANSSPYVRKVRVALAYKGVEYDNTQQVPLLFLVLTTLLCVVETIFLRKR